MPSTAPAWLARPEHHRPAPVVFAFALSFAAHLALAALPLNSGAAAHAPRADPNAARSASAATTRLQIVLREPTRASVQASSPVVFGDGVVQDEEHGAAHAKAPSKPVTLAGVAHAPNSHPIVDPFAGSTSPIPDEAEIAAGLALRQMPVAQAAPSPDAEPVALAAPPPDAAPRPAVMPMKLFGRVPVTQGGPSAARQRALTATAWQSMPRPAPPGFESAPGAAAPGAYNTGCASASGQPADPPLEPCTH